MSEFGRTPAYPQSAIYSPGTERIESSAALGCDMGLNIQQHIWLTVYAAAIAQGADRSTAWMFADASLPDALKRLEQLA